MQSATIVGVVRSPGGVPVAGAIVALGDGPKHPDIAAVTDARGAFRFAGLTPGVYAVIVTSPAQQVGVTVDAGPGATPHVDVVLPRMMLAAPAFADTQHVLDAIARRTPHAARRAGALLHRLLSEVESSPCPEFAWTASTLTGDGYPVEFTFSTSDEAIRYTVAPWPERPPPQRVALALELAESLTDTALPGPVADELLRLAGPAHSQRGAWVGGRHDDDSPAPDRLKLYVLPVAGTPASAAAIGGRAPELEERAIVLRLCAYEPATERHERYYRVRRLRPYHIRGLMATAGLERRAPELVALITDAYGHSIDAGLPGGSVGFSLAAALGRPPQFTLYLFARSLWGGDRRIRRAVERMSERHGWSLGSYLDVSATLGERDVFHTYHGMVGFVVAGEDAPIQLALGLRPPPLAPSP